MSIPSGVRRPGYLGRRHTAPSRASRSDPCCGDDIGWHDVGGGQLFSRIFGGAFDEVLHLPPEAPHFGQHDGGCVLTRESIIYPIIRHFIQNIFLKFNSMI